MKTCFIVKRGEIVRGQLTNEGERNIGEAAYVLAGSMKGSSVISQNQTVDVALVCAGCGPTFQVLEANLKELDITVVEQIEFHAPAESYVKRLIETIGEIKDDVILVVVQEQFFGQVVERCSNVAIYCPHSNLVIAEH